MNIFLFKIIFHANFTTDSFIKFQYIFNGNYPLLSLNIFSWASTSPNRIKNNASMRLTDTIEPARFLCRYISMWKIGPKHDLLIFRFLKKMTDLV